MIAIVPSDPTAYASLMDANVYGEFLKTVVH
jgi:cyanate lyase